MYTLFCQIQDLYVTQVDIVVHTGITDIYRTVYPGEPVTISDLYDYYSVTLTATTDEDKPFAYWTNSALFGQEIQDNPYVFNYQSGYGNRITILPHTYSYNVPVITNVTTERVEGIYSIQLNAEGYNFSLCEYYIYLLSGRYDYLVANGTISNNTSFSTIIDLYSKGFTYYKKLRVDVEKIIGEGQIYTTSFIYEAPPPSHFQWDSLKIQYGIFNLSADEWEKLHIKINEIRLYKDAGTYSFKYKVYEGDYVTADNYNDTVDSLADLSIYDVYEVEEGDSVTAQQLNYMVERLNSVI